MQQAIPCFDRRYTVSNTRKPSLLSAGGGPT